MELTYIENCPVEEDGKVKDFRAFTQALKSALSRFPEGERDTLTAHLRRMPLAGVVFNNRMKMTMQSQVNAGGSCIAFNPTVVNALSATDLEALITSTLCEAQMQMDALPFDSEQERIEAGVSLGEVEFQDVADRMATGLGVDVRRLDRALDSLVKGRK